MTKTKAWIPIGIIGATYVMVGLLFAWPVTHAQMWRLAAWVVSAFIYTAHICYERFRLGNSHARAALHAALGAAIGAFALAVNANLHAMHVGTPSRHRMLL